MKDIDLKDFTPERILIIQLRQIGDVLLTTPAVRALRERYPESRISYLVEKIPGRVLLGNPNIDEIIIRDTNGGKLEPLETIARVRRGRFDMVIDFLANPRTSLITLLSGARVSISYSTRRRRFAYTHPLKPEGVYSAAHKLSLLAALGCRTDELDLDMEVPEGAFVKADEFFARHGLEGRGPVVCMEPFHKRPVREWMPEHFAGLADMIKREWKAAVIIMWGPGREEDARRVMELATEDHYLAPPTDLHELAAFYRRADIFVGNDCGPRHIASSQGTPTFVILGPTDESWTPPGDIHVTVSKDIPCRPCNLRYCPEEHHACMRELKPDFVFSRLDEFRRFLEERKQAV